MKIPHKKSEGLCTFSILNIYKLCYDKNVELKESERRIKEVDFCGPETLRKSQKQNIERSISHETKEEILVDGCMLCNGSGNLLPCFCDGYHCKYKFTHIN